MATTQSPKDANAKVKKDPKPPVPAITRINDLLKRSALQGKISKDELESVANLAKALQTFMSA